MLGYTCGEYPLGGGDRDTNLTISVEDRHLDSNFNYRIYMVYKLIDVNAHTMKSILPNKRLIHLA